MSPPPTTHRRGPLHEASTRVQAIHPSSLPLACDPRMQRASLGLSPELRTPPTRSRTTHVRARTGRRARTWNYTLNITSADPPIGSSLATSDLASQRPLGKRGAAGWRSAGSSWLFGAHNSAIVGGHRHAVDAATATVALRKRRLSRRERRSSRAAPRPRALDVGDCDSAPGLLGGRFRASTITCCVGTGRTEGPLRPRSPGCRLARRSGHLVLAGPRAAPYRSSGKRFERAIGGCSIWESNSGEPLAGRGESGDRQAPSRLHRRRRRRT
jgi:hypothetical protein